MAAKNLVQFQPGLSLMAFLDRYGSEQQCREALVKARWAKEWRCPDCGHTSHCRLKRRDVYQRNRSTRQLSLTSGTLFAETTLPLRTWFPAIYLLTQHDQRKSSRGKNDIPALALRRQLGVSYNAARLLKHDSRKSSRDRLNRRFDLAALVPRLIVTAARTPPLSYRLATLVAWGIRTPFGLVGAKRSEGSNRLRLVAQSYVAEHRFARDARKIIGDGSGTDRTARRITTAVRAHQAKPCRAVSAMHE